MHLFFSFNIYFEWGRCLLIFAKSKRNIRVYKLFLVIKILFLSGLRQHFCYLLKRSIIFLFLMFPMFWLLLLCILYLGCLVCLFLFIPLQGGYSFSFFLCLVFRCLHRSFS